MIQIKSQVFYDEENHLYYKEFKRENWYSLKGLKYFLGIYRTHARNIEYMTKRLNELSLNTPLLIKTSDYLSVSAEVEGEGLDVYRMKHGSAVFREELLRIFITITQAGIIHVDPNLCNFLYDGKKIIIIDIDSIFDLADMPLKFLPRQKHLYKLWYHLDYDNDFLAQVAKSWPKRTLLQQGMDAIYAIRTHVLAGMGRGDKEEQKFLAFITPHFPS